MTILKQLRSIDAQPGPMEPLVPYVAMCDNLATPRRIATAVIAADGARPLLVVDVGSCLGELLEAFLDRFPGTQGQWTDASESFTSIAQKRLSKFGDRVDYGVGCPGRDVSDGTVPGDVDVLTTSWVSAHRDIDGTFAFYREAGELLAPGGWRVVLDHIGYHESSWERCILAARGEFHAAFEGSPPHHENNITTREHHLAAFAAAGIDDARVIWESLGNVLFMGCRAGRSSTAT